MCSYDETNKLDKFISHREYDKINKEKWSLEYFSLNCYSRDSFDGLKLPSSILKLEIDFKSNNLSLEKVILPEKLEQLVIIDNYGYDFAHVKIPDSVNNLGLYCCFNQSLDKLKLPLKLHTLELGPVFDQNLNLEFPENFSTIKVSLSSNTKTLSSLPLNLKRLYIDVLDRPLENLPINLQFLSIWKDESENLKKSKIPFNTKVFLEEEFVF